MTEARTKRGGPLDDRRLTRADMEAAALAGRQLGADIDSETALRLLREGELTVVGRLLSASNATFYCVVEGQLGDGQTGWVSCVYKPGRGERPLFDFPDGTLSCREAAAYEVSLASGWDLIPPTVLRDGPLGPGMVQLWMETDPNADVAELLEREAPALRRMALLDAILNNADRKGGHLLPLPDGRVIGIDNGLCFAEAGKLRTILWQWRGQPLSDEEVAMLARLRAQLAGPLGERLRDLLSAGEVEVTARRVERLLRRRRFPMPDPRRPALPWPPF
jgi:uncharacterized repeat protein (TIGR03843 family)